MISRRSHDQSGADAREIARDMVARAEAARGEGLFSRAAFLFEEALRLRPERTDWHVQAGHMYKEAFDSAAAEHHYRAAAERMPNDPDLALQLGHFFKTGGRLAEAEKAYRHALALKPTWPAAQQELDTLRAAGWRLAEPGAARAAAAVREDQLLPPLERLAADAEAMGLAPELAARPMLDTLRGHGEEIAIRHLGRPHRSRWGVMNTVRGVQAFRGFCISDTPVTGIEITLNGQMIHRGRLKGGFVLPNERDDPRKRRYTFNAWIDLTNFAPGKYDVVYRATKLDGTTLSRVEQVVIAPPLAPSPLPDSDTNVPSANPADQRSLDEQIMSRPSMVRPAKRALLASPPKTVLVLRPDVLGDLVVAVPALRRLREVLPGTRLVGLLSAANVDLARTLALFDEIVLTELVYSPHEQRRVVSLDAQRNLADQLRRFDFDMAIDFGTSPDSRLLMPLSGAPVLIGFRSDALPGLTVEVTGGTKDPWNGHENVPHTNMALALVAWLEAMLRSEKNITSRPLSRGLLANVGLGENTDYIVLHSGGRWQFSRWPHYNALAELILARTGLNVVLMTTDPSAEEHLPKSLAASDRFHLLHRRLHFDELDALLSFSSVFVGDDSGVKHLASLRGAQVIGIQNARNNWCEWGHDQGGYIITRKIPCAGCLIQNYPESDECGRDFACITGIRPRRGDGCRSEDTGPGALGCLTLRLPSA